MLVWVIDLMAYQSLMGYLITIFHSFVNDKNFQSSLEIIFKSHFFICL